VIVFGPADIIQALRIGGSECDEKISPECTGISEIYIAGLFLCRPCCRMHTFECRDDDHSNAAAVFRVTVAEMMARSGVKGRPS
jgi:hypothetical protein